MAGGGGGGGGAVGSGFGGGAASLTGSGAGALGLTCASPGKKATVGITTLLDYPDTMYSSFFFSVLTTLN